jgi:alkyl hydroperoxide reductase subunit AhpC
MGVERGGGRASILQPAPEFKALAAMGGGAVREVSLAALAGRWVAVFFYPRDFTAVCPTELRELSKRMREFRDLGTEVLAVSVDSLERHQQWIASELGEVAFPLAADPTKEIARRWGVLLEPEGVAARATFVVDPAGVVQYACFHNLAVGRSISETLRVLEALQTGERSPAEWRRGSATLGR